MLRQPVLVNATMNSRQVRQFCRPETAVAELLKTAITHLGLSARAYNRVLKLSRTIADLAGEDVIGVPQVAGRQHRSLDRQF